MAEFLDTTGVSYRLSGIIKNAQERLLIISPYLKVNDLFRELLEDADRLEYEIFVIYGKSELLLSQEKWLRSLKSVKVGYLQNLHAKCYMNENEALVTSMNLYEFSQVNNYEMGIYVSRGEDPALYEEIRRESMRLVRASKISPITPRKVQAEDSGTQRESETPSHVVEEPIVESGKVSRSAPVEVKAVDSRNPEASYTHSRVAEVPTEGYCIRCGIAVPFNLGQPYCGFCRHIRGLFKDRWPDKQCHTCGSKFTTSIRQPQCDDCYGKYKDVLALAAG